MFSVFFSFVFALLASLVPDTEGQCRTLRFTSAGIDNHLLKNHVVRTIDVINEDLCSTQCYLEPNCVSYNFKKEKEANGQHKCDLNNDTFEDDNEHAEDLVKTDTYMYRGAQNSCAKKPCKNNATCQAGFTDKDYQCLCTPGFTGHDCHLDINECNKGTHSCDVNSVCNNTQGSFYCTCKDGFVGNGNKCNEIDECANGTHNCDDNAVCNNTQGSYNCTCKDGFVGDGKTCTDIDECSANFLKCKAGFEENCSAISVPDPIALYPLNSKYKTREINNRQPQGTPVGVSLEAGPDGEPCGSHRFSGQVNSYVQFPNNGGLDAQHSITMLCWIYPENTAGPLFSYETSGLWGVHLWVINPGKLFARFMRRNYQITPHLVTDQLRLKEWYYVGASYDHTTGNAVLWLNGQEVVQQNIGAGMTLATQDNVRMGVKEGNSRYFKGRITAMQIYDVALTAEQINKVKNAGRDTWHCCDFNAMCQNTPGSYECSCADGFSGDGKYCTDIDECANGAQSCDDNAVCNNTQGSYNCACKDGFVGDGKNCTEKPPSVIICEGSTSTISCQNHKIIKVLEANYGRLNRHTCIDSNMNNIYCTSSNSLKIVQQTCDRKTSCTVSASNSVFGDPCGGTSKYLELKYRCM